MKREEALKRYCETMRMMRYSHKTIEAYRDWIGIAIPAAERVAEIHKEPGCE